MYLTRLSVCSLLIAFAGVARPAYAQFQNPAGFQDPAGASRGGTGNPPNAPGGTLSPSPGGYMSPQPFNTFSGSREIENNPALRQEVRRPFGGGGFRSPGMDPSVSPREGWSSPDFNFRDLLDKDRPVSGPATGGLAADWRYSYYRGRHWYWMPDNSWQVWTGAAWVPYRHHMFEQPLFGAGTQVRGYRPLPAGAGVGSAIPTAAPKGTQQAVAATDGLTHGPDEPSAASSPRRMPSDVSVSARKPLDAAGQEQQ